MNLIELTFFKVYPPMKPHILFYSGLAIVSGFHDIPQNFVIIYPTATN